MKNVNSVLTPLALGIIAGSVLAQSAPQPPGPPAPPQGERQRGERFQGQGGPGGPGGGGFGGTWRGPGGMGGGLAGMADLFRADFSKRDIRFFDEQLKFDSMQRLVFETLVEDYEKEFRAGSEEVQQKFAASLNPQMFQGRGQQRGQTGAAPNDEQRQMREKMRERFRELRQEMEQARQQMGPDVDEEKIRQIWRDKSEAIRKEFPELQDMQPRMPQMSEIQKMMGDLSPVMDQWRVKKIGLRDQFLVDVQNQLTEPQVAAWPAFERSLRREQTLSRNSMLSGEGVNLFHIVRELDPEGALKAQTASVLADYDVALDAALQARNGYVESSQKDLYQAITEMNTEKGLALIERQTRLRVAVRDVNLQFAETLAAALPEGEAAKLRAAVREAAFPRIFRSTPTQRLFKAAKGIDGLDPAVLASLEAAEQSYLTELAAANERLMQVTRTNEPLQVSERAREMAARFTQQEYQETADPIRDEMTKRNQMGERYQLQIKSALTADQFESISQSRRAGRDGGQPGQRTREDWDSNGDGVIDDNERAEGIRRMGDRIYGPGGGTQD